MLHVRKRLIYIRSEKAICYFTVAPVCDSRKRIVEVNIITENSLILKQCAMVFVCLVHCRNITYLAVLLNACYSVRIGS